MAIPSTTDFEAKGSLEETEDIQMTIDENGMQFLMSILTNLYENPTLAVVREYSTNAADAHIEAGYDGPVEVTLPTHFQKNFIVKDYGPGMDLEDIRNTYSKYVASTKRQSNTQAGMFGIGSKSALALGDTFVVESIKGGRKIEVVVLRQGRGKATMKVTNAGTPTKEPDGTTIKVPARDPYQFERAADEFYKYVKKGVFTVNGEDKGETFDGLKVDDDTYILSSGGYNAYSVIVMGNVPYKVSNSSRRAIVKYVEPGTFEPTPPREGLERTRGFDDRINGYLDEAADHVASSVSEDIKDMDNGKAAEHILTQYNLLSTWNALDKVVLDGHRLGDDYKFRGCVRLMGSTTISPDKSTKFKHYLLGAHVTEHDAVKISDFSENTIRKAWAARSHVGYADNVFLYYKGQTPAYAVPNRVVTWERAKNFSNYGGGYSRSSRSYGASVQKAGDDWKVPTKKAHYDPDRTPTYPKGWTKIVPFDDWKGKKDPRRLVYFSPTEVDTRSKVTLINSLVDDSDVLLVIKYINQQDKVKREHPEAEHFESLGEEIAKGLVKKHGQGPFIDAVYPKEWEALKDYGDFKRAWEITQTSVSYSSVGLEPDQYRLVRELAASALTDEAEFGTLTTRIKENYPLLSSLSWSAKKEHVEDYVRAMDAMKESE